MRPLTLRMSGLRSYRSEVTIDFGDPGLIAIVGDTGSGKSSILEALFFALYGGCTWDHRAAVPLISDGASMLQAELIFVAEGRRWRVFRSASRSAAQSRHELECLDEPALRFDNHGPVSYQIKRLVGLDQDGFLRTVILPQGRFQVLLQATRADRTAILKGIFRLDQLAAAREQADLAARRLRPGLQNLRDERAALLPDPTAALADARERHDQARARLAELQDLSQKVTAAARQREEARRQASDLHERERQVRDILMPSAGTDLANLAAAAGRLADQRRQLEAGRQQRRQEADSLTEVLTRASDQGEGLEALASAASTVSFLAGQLPDLAEEAAGCEQEERALEALAESIHARQADAASLAEQASAARVDQTTLAAAAGAASDLLTQARTRLATARNRAATSSERQSAVKDAAEHKSAVEAAIEPAEMRARAAKDERDTARSALEAVQRANAAAHAAEGCHFGDPCPICRRPLPTDFAMPPPPGDADARTRLTAAEQAAGQSAEYLAARQADLVNASRDLDRAGPAAREAEAALADALAELRLVLPVANLDAEDEALLAPLVTASDTAAADRDAQAEQASKLAQQSEAAAATTDALRQQLQQRSSQLGNRQEAVRVRKAGYEQAVGELPAAYRVDAPLTTQALAAAADRIDSRRAELTQISDQLAETRKIIDGIGRELETLNDQVRAQVDDPAQRIILRLTAAGQRLNDLATLLGTLPGPARPPGGLADDAEWANRLSAATDAALSQAQAAITRAEQQRDQALATITRALAAAGVDDEPGLQQVIINVSADLRRAADDIQTATEQIPQVAELARKIQHGQELLEALDELGRLLTDGNFIGYVVTRRQQTLLAIATELLGSMTGERYGFSETFEIVDRLTGLPRGAKTLSGGETFLASLALALGLVELAGRGGGRLDALFLDEGFGSLDANSLSEALDALGRQADTGRLVAVISHLRSVAESMDRVLAVTTGPSGSQVRWLGGSERDDLITQDIEASLLT
jgi:DNA repair protein SbcC/Rad50